MNLDILEKVKEDALENHIPIIMDDTLDVIKDYLEKVKPIRILEIGTAVRIFCKSICKVFRKSSYN